MSTSLKSIAAASLLLVGTAAMAQTVPPQPAPGPVPSSQTENGGVIVSIWDSVRGVSLVQYLGLRLNDILPTGTNMQTPGFTLNFGTIGEYGSVFGSSDAANIVYHVTASDSVGGAVSGRRTATTAALGQPFTISGARSRDVAAAIQTYIDDRIINPNSCNGANPCIATSPSDFQYAGLDSFGAFLNLQMPVNASAAVDTALGFYFITSPTTTQQPGVVSAYQASTGFSSWLLSSSGVLTYSVPPIPLPAAVWLLLSGLAGLVTVGRRRNAAVAA